MTTAILNSPDFQAIAKEVLPSPQSTPDRPHELVPAAVASRQQREGNQFMRRPNALGATVDREGLTNTYAVEPLRISD